MKNRKFRVLCAHVCIVIASVILGYIYYTECVVNADMAGSIVDVYKEREYLGQGFFSNFINKNMWQWAMGAMYDLFGMKIILGKMAPAIFFLVCSFITMEICAFKDGFDWEYFPLAVFILIPGISTNRFHLMSALINICVLWYLGKRKKSESKKRDIVAFVTFILACKFTNDILLIVLNIILPIIIYIIYRMLKDKKYEKYVYIGILILTAICMVWSLSFSGMLKIYGADEYFLGWTSLGSLWNIGIGFLIETISRAMNINVSGPVIQPLTLAWIVRIVLMIGAVAELVIKVKEILKGKISDLFSIELCGCVILSTILFLLNGTRLSGYEKYGYNNDYSSYMAIVWFALVILAVDFVKRISKKKHKAFYCAASILLCILYMIPTVQLKQKGIDYVDSRLAEYLVDNNIEGAISVQDSSTTVTSWSEGRCYSIPYWTKDSEMNWGYRKVNAYLENLSHNKSEPEEYEKYLDNLAKERYGEWYTKEKFREDIERPETSEYAAERVAYLYDHDIRWKKRNIDLRNSSVSEVNLYLPMGENRIHIYGNNVAEVEAVFKSEDGKNLTAEKVIISDSAIDYLIMCNNGSEVYMIYQQIPENTDIHAIEQTVIRAAVTAGENIDIEAGQDYAVESELLAGDYNLIILGENLNNLEITSSDISSDIKILQDGNSRRIISCHFSTSEPAVIIHNSNKNDVSIDKVYYELTVEAREQQREEWNAYEN